MPSITAPRPDARTATQEGVGARDGAHWFTVPAIVRAHPLATLILAGLAVRLALTPLYANLPDGLLDEGFWKHWMEIIDREGVLNIFRASDTDYVGYHWVLWALAGVYDVIGGPYTQTTPSLHILVKMPSIAFDVALILAVYYATAALVGDRSDAAHLPLISAAVIAFQPAVLYDSAVWAQTDSAITAAMLGAIVLAHSARPAWAGACYALGLAVKPHPVIVGPILLLALLRRGGVRAALVAGAAVLAVAAIIVGPWILHGDLARIIDVYQLLFSKDHSRLSELAWNVWWIFDYAADPRPGTQIAGPLTFRMVGLALSAGATLLAVAYAAGTPGLRFALIAAAYQAFAFYALPIASHERYLYPFLAFLLPVAVIDRRWLWLYVPLSATFFLNLFVVAPPIAGLADRWVYNAFGPSIAVANMVMFAAFTVVLARGTAESYWRPGQRLGLDARHVPASSI
jgi:Gpi18-like mannosyltransferase